MRSRRRCSGIARSSRGALAQRGLSWTLLALTPLRACRAVLSAAQAKLSDIFGLDLVEAERVELDPTEALNAGVCFRGSGANRGLQHLACSHSGQQAHGRMARSEQAAPLPTRREPHARGAEARVADGHLGRDASARRCDLGRCVPGHVARKLRNWPNSVAAADSLWKYLTQLGISRELPHPTLGDVNKLLAEFVSQLYAHPLALSPRCVRNCRRREQVPAAHSSTRGRCAAVSIQAWAPCTCRGGAGHYSHHGHDGAAACALAPNARAVAHAQLPDAWG